MKELHFLVIGKNEPILDTLLTVIHKNPNWKAIGVTDEDLIYPLIGSGNFDIVLLSCGLEKQLEEAIKKFCLVHAPSVKVIDHYGGGSGLLNSEVLTEFPELIS
ncbi:hypothetical protein ABGT15_05065 [Flavobacterium enshiense]|uniref:hypothetical protein n=1 Tax=Flavobacterium enshiense TaxID=1341165 RepID=UPI00345C9124